MRAVTQHPPRIAGYAARLADHPSGIRPTWG